MSSGIKSISQETERECTNKKWESEQLNLSYS